MAKKEKNQHLWTTTFYKGRSILVQIINYLRSPDKKLGETEKVHATNTIYHLLKSYSMTGVYGGSKMKPLNGGDYSSEEQKAHKLYLIIQ
jgi:hypothetical protein